MIWMFVFVSFEWRVWVPDGSCRTVDCSSERSLLAGKVDGDGTEVGEA